MIPSKKSGEKRPQIDESSDERRSQEKAPKITKRENGRDTIKPWGTTPNHLYISKRFIQGLACRPIILPSHKISPWRSQASPMESLGKIGRENSKSKWTRVSRDGCHPLSPLSLYGDSRKTKIPLKLKLRYTPTKGTLEYVFVAPSDGCPVTALRVASTQALRPRRVSSTSKLLSVPGSRLRPPSLRSWFYGSTM
jgi:hypothetical protein